MLPPSMCHGCVAMIIAHMIFAAMGRVGLLLMCGGCGVGAFVCAVVVVVVVVVVVFVCACVMCVQRVVFVVESRGCRGRGGEGCSDVSLCCCDGACKCHRFLWECGCHSHMS